jgi:hypothetical protein
VVVMDTVTLKEVDAHISVIDGGRILLAGCGDNTDVRTKKKKKKTILRDHTGCEDADVVTSSYDKDMESLDGSVHPHLRRTICMITRRRG